MEPRKFKKFPQDSKRGKSLRHFTNATTIYDSLISSVGENARGRMLEQIYVYSLTGCLVNLPKGLWMALSGQFVDSHFYIRRTIESVRVCCFIRENPKHAEDWYGNTQEARSRFKRAQQSWFTKEGRATLDRELPDFNRIYDHTSLTGIHANSILAGFQNEVIPEGGGASLRILFHDTEEGPKTTYNIIALFYTHLRIHFETIEWWTARSELPFALSGELRDLWFYQAKEFRQGMDSFMASLPKEMIPRKQ